MANETWPVHNIAATHTLATATVESMKKWDRKAADLYPTPEECTQALVNILALPKGTRVREPACGDGKLARVLHLAGLETVCSDLRQTGYGRGGVDYLTAEPDPDEEACSWTWTNPPFNLAEEFILKALEQTPNVAMLLKSNYWHAARCLPLFERHRPTCEYRLCWRPAFLADERGNNPLMDVSWVVWRRSAGGLATWRPVRKPKEFPRLKPMLDPQLATLRDAFDDMTEALRART